MLPHPRVTVPAARRRAAAPALAPPAADPGPGRRRPATRGGEGKPRAASAGPSAIAVGDPPVA